MTQLEHALQCALLRGTRRCERRTGHCSACCTISATCCTTSARRPPLQGIDDVHQYRALPFLRGLFGDAVIDPIKLHVDAKRYLCAVRPRLLRRPVR